MFVSAIQNTTFKLLLVVLIAPQVHSAEKGRPGGEKKKSPPSFQQVEASVKKYFQKLPDFDSQGIITASQTAPVFTLLQRAGWNIEKKDRQALLDRVLPDKGFLAKQLSSPSGKKLSAQIYKYPGGYDRLDRLSRMPQGRDTVSRLISGPDGYKMIQYMTTVPGGKNMGLMLSDSPLGKNFNKPTGRIYTVEMLLTELGKLYKDTFEKKPAKKPVGK